MLEFFVTTVCSAVLIGVCVLVHYLFSIELLTFLLGCAVGALLGYLLAVVEERWSPFEEHYGKFELFFTTVMSKYQILHNLFQFSPISSVLN